MYSFSFSFSLTWNAFQFVMVYNYFYSLLHSVGEHFVEDFCISCLRRCWPVVFLSHNVFSLVLILSNTCLIEWIRKSSHCLCLLEDIVKNWYLLLKYLVMFTRETIWAWCFFLWEVINYWSNFFNKYKLHRLSISLRWVLVSCVF